MSAVAAEAVGHAARKPSSRSARRSPMTGTNFAVASGVADGMLLCLFDEAGAETRIPLLDRDAGVWHVFVPGVGAGQAYGYRATGPYDPARGVRCHPARLLLDPYARAVTGTVRFGPEVLGYSGGDQDVPNEADSAPCVPRSVVVADAPFAWRDGARRRRDVRGHDHLRGARQGLHHAPSRGAARAARDLRGPGPRGGHRPPARPRRDRGRAAAGARERPRGVPGAARG